MTVSISAKEIKPGDRVEFRQYGYKQDYCTGRVQKLDGKFALIAVDNAMRRAKIEIEDITKVMQ